MEEKKERYVRWTIKAEEGFANEEEAKEAIAEAQKEKDNEKAMLSIVRKNLTMINKYARHYSSNGSSFDDLQSEGMVAVINAVKAYNGECSVGTALITAVRTAMRRYANADRNVHIAINASEIKNKIHAIAERLRAEDKEVTIELIAKEANLPLKKAKKLFSVDCGIVSMNMKADGDEGETNEFGDTLADEHKTAAEMAEQNDDYTAMYKALAKLTDIEQLIIEYTFGLNGKEKKTLAELAEMLDRSIEGVRQLKNKAVENMKKVYEV